MAACDQAGSFGTGREVEVLSNPVDVPGDGLTAASGRGLLAHEGVPAFLGSVVLGSQVRQYGFEGDDLLPESPCLGVDLRLEVSGGIHCGLGGPGDLAAAGPAVPPPALVDEAVELVEPLPGIDGSAGDAGPLLGRHRRRVGAGEVVGWGSPVSMAQVGVRRIAQSRVRSSAAWSASSATTRPGWDLSVGQAAG